MIIKKVVKPIWSIKDKKINNVEVIIIDYMGHTSEGYTFQEAWKLFILHAIQFHLLKLSK